MPIRKQVVLGEVLGFRVDESTELAVTAGQWTLDKDTTKDVERGSNLPPTTLLFSLFPCTHI